MSDLIDRQAAIDEVINLWADKPFGNPTLVEIKCCIEALPSAHPTQTNADSTQCNTLDCVDRQEAIDIIQSYKKNTERCHEMSIEDVVDMLEDMIDDIKNEPSAQPERPEQPESAKEYCAECNHIEMCRWYPYEGCEFRSLPSAQTERDIPKKPLETTDRAWGIPHRQAVCPECDYYLGHVAFLGDYKGKRITYCETCGQAIDWEGWEFEK